jgi:hypothetical protein
MFSDEAKSRGKGRERRRVDLEIPSAVLTEEALRGLIDDWLAPAIADTLMQQLIASAARERG